MTIRSYTGTRNVNKEAQVRIYDEHGKEWPLPIEPSLKLANHSPAGFEWGYGGSGPAQLALAILLDYTGDKDLARRLHQDFKRDMIALLPHDEWVLSGVEIARWLQEQEPKTFPA